MNHPLAGACARIDRADKHFEELKTIIEGFQQANENQFFAQRNRATMKVRNSLKLSVRAKGIKLKSIPPDAAVVVSDVIHNLRAALDYLVYELACENFPSIPHHGTQFIIKDSKADTNSPTGRPIYGFDSDSRTRLKRLKTHQITAIENLQPYKGVTWTKTLRDISNPDKHRKLTVIGGHWEGVHFIEGGAPGSFVGRPGKVFPGTGVNGTDVYEERQHAIEVQLPDGSSVLKTLEILKREVRTTIDAFKPEFKI